MQFTKKDIEGSQISTQKLQKILAIAGLGSRREIEKWIQAGRFTVNGQVASLGVRVSEKDKVMLDNRLLKLPTLQTKKESKCLLYYKRDNEICSMHDPQGRHTVFETLPSIHPERWVMMGRLDFNTLGLLLFTTDGLLSHRLLHPSYEIEREYAVRVHGMVTSSMMQQFKKGILLEGKVASFSSIIAKSHAGGANHWYHVILKEGRQREVRKLFATQGLTVTRLIRVRFGPIVLPKTLRVGQSIWLSDDEVGQLKRCVNL